MKLSAEICSKAVVNNIVFSIPVKVNSHVLIGLQHGVIYSTENLDLTLTCVAMFEAIQGKLSGTPMDNIKNKIVGMRYGAQGDFQISVDVQATFSAVRKMVGLIAKYLSPQKYYSKYQDLCKMINLIPDREVFDGACKEILDKISSVQVHVVGKAKITPEKEKALSAVLKAKLHKESLSASKGKRSLDKIKITEFTLKSYTGSAVAVFFAQRVISHLTAAETYCFNGHIFVADKLSTKIGNVNEAKVETIVRKITESPDCACLLQYLSGITCGAPLDTFARKPSESIVNAIIKMLH